LLNPDTVPGKANRYLARRVDVIFTQFQDTTEHFSAFRGGKIKTVGCPVRSSLLDASHEEAIRHFRLEPERRTLLINGGSQGASSINEATAFIDDRLEALAGRWQIIHITGPSDIIDDQDLGRERQMLIRKLSYCDRMDLAYAAADLVLGRAGASSVAELAATGTPAVLMPYPYHADNHQRLNAEALAGEDAQPVPPVLIVDDATDAATNADRLTDTLLPVLEDDDLLKGMQAAAKRAARPDAADRVADWLLQYAG
jgi:UDP-N-acetylglucosamine--N-acetylmuramyl-(pentapeptide) pyrophosphoryl-undecaprenol N-acetylglucosamine transferase